MSKNTRVQHIVGWLLIVLVIIGAVIAISFVSTEVEAPDPVSSAEYSFAKDAITTAGPWGPLAFVAAQAAQAIIAPIPGPVIAMLGGYLYGGLWATILSIIGSAIGFYVIFLISKKIGRPILLRYMKPARLKKYEQVLAARGGLFLYIAFLLPVLPDSITGYIAGLSNIPVKKLLLIATIGRTPGIIMAAYIGSSAAAANYALTIAGLAAVIILCVFFYLYRTQFEKWLLSR